MSRGFDSSEQQNPVRKRVQPVDQESAVEAVTAPEGAAPDVQAMVQEAMQTSYGNAIVQAALKGADIEGLGGVIAGEVAATAAGMGALSQDGKALQASGNDALMRAAAKAQRNTFNTSDALNELRGGGGRQLPTGVREQMERAFGQSFAHVRVHTETAAAAEALGADAVAMGSHIHFREGAYDPSSTSGRAIIAHELTHVVQAMEGRLPGVGGVSATSMSTEQEAYANEALATVRSIDVDGFGSFDGASLDGGVQMASAVDTSIAPSALASPMGAGFDGASAASLGVGSFGAGVGAASMAPVSGAVAGTGISGATGPVEASTSAPAMLRESDDIDQEESDTEASARHEVAMGLDQGFRRSIDMSQGEHTVNVAKEGTSRRDGVFTEPSASGHLAVDEYNAVMRDIGPDGESRASGADENLTDSAQHTQTENDGHAHLDDSFKLGAAPEAPSFVDAPGGDPVMGGATPGMVSGADKAGIENDLGSVSQEAPGHSTSSGPMTNDLVNTALAGTFGQDISRISARVDDAANQALGAKGFTQNSDMAFRSDMNVEDATDKEAMELVGHEVAHALAGGGTSQNAVDQENDPGEAIAQRQGEQFADYMASGMRGPAPRLSAAVGGKAKRHRMSDDDSDSDGPEQDAPERQTETTVETDYDAPEAGAANDGGRQTAKVEQGGTSVKVTSELDGTTRTGEVGLDGTVSGTYTTEGGVTTGASFNGSKATLSAGTDAGTLTVGATQDSVSLAAASQTAGGTTFSGALTATDYDRTKTTDTGQVTETGDGMSVAAAVGPVGASYGELDTSSTTIKSEDAAELGTALDEGRALDALDAGESIALADAHSQSFGASLGANGIGVEAGYQKQVSSGVLAEADDQGNLSLTYDEATIEKTSGALTYNGFGVTGEMREGERSGVTVDVDETQLTDAGRAELEASLKSGVLPGAHALESEAAQAASAGFQQAEARVADLEARMAAIDGNSRQQQRQRQSLSRQLAAANGQMQDHRNTLNSEWRDANGAGTEVMPGVTVKQEVQAESAGGSVGITTPVGSATAYSDDTEVETKDVLAEDGSIVTTTTRTDEKGGFFTTDRKGTAGWDTDGNVTLSTTRDITQGTPEAEALRAMEGTHDGDIDYDRVVDGARKAARSPTPAKTFEEVTASQTVTSEDLQRAGDLQNLEEGAAERFEAAGDRLADLYTDSTRTRARNGQADINLGKTIAGGGEIEGVAFDVPGDMSAQEIAGVYSGVTGPQDLAALSETHPDQATALQSNFVKGAVAGGAIEQPQHVIGMVATIQDPQARARTMAEVTHMLSERGDDASLAMMGELQRLSSSDPNLRAAIASGMSTDYTPPTPRTSTGSRGRR